MPADKTGSAPTTRPRDLARLIASTAAPRRALLLSELPPERIASALPLLAEEQVAEALSALSSRALTDVLDNVPQESIPALLAGLPVEVRSEVLALMEPVQASATRAVLYQRDLRAALTRLGGATSDPEQPGLSPLPVTFSGSTVACVPFFREFGALTSAEVDHARASASATTTRFLGVLAVTNVGRSAEAIDCQHLVSTREFRVETVTWASQADDDRLRQSLARAAGGQTEMDGGLRRERGWSSPPSRSEKSQRRHHIC